jgi:predicted MFS family arabinose efflux permease
MAVKLKGAVMWRLPRAPKIPEAYRRLLQHRPTRLLLTGLGASALGDGLSIVTIAWLAVRIAPASDVGFFVGLAVAAYTLPGVIGAVAFGRLLRGRPARTMLLAHCLLRAGCLGAVALLYAGGTLAPALYVILLAGSSLMYAWGNAGQYTMLSEAGGPEGRMAVNSLASAQVSFATIVGPLLAGLLLGFVSPGLLLAVDAASFAFLGVVAWRAGAATEAVEQPIDSRAAESGFRLLRRPDLLSLTLVTWVFFFLYGPVEVALPVYVAVDLQGPSELLGAYWTTFGVGALAANLITGTIRGRNMRRITLLIVAGWGACLLPFAFAPIPVTLVAFALGGVIYGPFIPLTYALFQSSTTAANLPSVLAARSAVVMISTPLGTAIGGPLVGALGAAGTLGVSGLTTLVLAAAAGVLWTGKPSDGEATGQESRNGRSGIEKPPTHRGA